jgi:hypothetical protein
MPYAKVKRNPDGRVVLTKPLPKAIRIPPSTPYPTTQSIASILIISKGIC